MEPAMKLLDRVLLFVPGDQERKLEKAFGSAADAVVIDWEDGVGETDKDAARERTVRFVSELPEERRGGKRIIIRCNHHTSGWFEQDLAALVSLPVDAVMVPKCEEPADIGALAEWKGEILPIMETARGIHRAENILSSSDQIRRAVFGSVDFALDLGVDWSPGGSERIHALGWLILVSRSLGMQPPIDAAFPAYKDEAAFKVDVELGRKMGCSGKLVIHPSQIAAARAAYTPSARKIAWAREIVAGWDSGHHSGSLQIGGQLVDLPVVEAARRILAEADLGG